MKNNMTEGKPFVNKLFEHIVPIVCVHTIIIYSKAINKGAHYAKFRTLEIRK